MHKYRSNLLAFIFWCTEKNGWLKENLRGENSEIKSKSVDLEFNDANDRENNSNVNSIIIAAVNINNDNDIMINMINIMTNNIIIIKIIINNINNNKNNYTTKNNSNNYDNIIFLTRNIIVIMEDLVITINK